VSGAVQVTPGEDSFTLLKDDPLVEKVMGLWSESDLEGMPELWDISKPRGH
jgi:hypothetical protein